MSWKLGTKFHFHLSGGFIYVSRVTVDNNDSVNYLGKTYVNYFSPDLSVNIDYRMKSWIALHATASYGSTFIYNDNIPTKEEFMFAARIAPFVHSKHSFFRYFRFEAGVISIYYEAARHQLTLPAGIFQPIGYLYWQWNWRKNRKKK